MIASFSFCLDSTRGINSTVVSNHVWVPAKIGIWKPGVRCNKLWKSVRDPCKRECGGLDERVPERSDVMKRMIEYSNDDFVSMRQLDHVPLAHAPSGSLFAL